MDYIYNLFEWQTHTFSYNVWELKQLKFCAANYPFLFASEVFSAKESCFSRTKLLRNRTFIRRLAVYPTDRCGPLPPFSPSWGAYTHITQPDTDGIITQLITHTSTQPAKGHALHQSYSLFPPTHHHPIQSTAPHRSRQIDWLTQCSPGLLNFCS
jgi:hypothetical protein